MRQRRHVWKNAVDLPVAVRRIVERTMARALGALPKRSKVPWLSLLFTVAWAVWRAGIARGRQVERNSAPSNESSQRRKN